MTERIVHKGFESYLAVHVMELMALYSRVKMGGIANLTACVKKLIPSSIDGANKITDLTI